jgi:hypothetical protein
MENNAQANRTDGNSLRDTKAPLEYVHDGKPEPELPFAHASCRITSFRRSHVSKVCQRGGVLLAFAASQKCRKNRRRLQDCFPNVRGQMHAMLRARG